MIMTTSENDFNIYTTDQEDNNLWAARIAPVQTQVDVIPPRREKLWVPEEQSSDPYLDRLEEVDPMVEEEKPRFKLLSRSDLKALPDPEWLIDKLLPADSFTVVYGAPGAAKSFMALDMACSVASGHTLHGAQVKQGAVLLAVGEGLRGMKWREEAWALAHTDADIEALDRNLHILPKAVHLLEQKDSDMLINTAEFLSKQGESLRLVIIDTWARAMVGGDENSAKDAGIAIDVCERIREKTGATVLVVHHTGADGQRERGSTALRGAADTSISMAKEDNSGVITMATKKMKDGEPQLPQTFSLSQYGNSAVLLPAEGAYRPGSVFKKQYPSKYGDAF